MKKTKQLWIIAIFFLAIIYISMPVSADVTTNDAFLTASVAKYEPLPAEPGNFMTVYIKLENIGNKDAKDAVIEIMPEFPFNIDPAAAKKEIGILGSQTDFVQDFRVRVDDNAISGINRLKIRYTTNSNSGLWIEQDLNIRVQSIGSDIQITSVTTEPEELVPGETGKLRIRIKNDAASTMRDIKLNLDLGDTTTTTYPFIPVGTTSQQRIGSLPPGQSSEFVYEIRPYPDALSKLYKIPLTLTYTDNQETEYTKTDLVGIIVNSKPDLDVVIDDFRNDGTVIFKIINKGLTNAKLLSLELLKNDDYSLVSQSSEEYIGDLDSDDFDTADFQINLLKPKSSLPVKISYRDANNKLYEENFNLEVKGSAQNTNGNTSTGTVIIILIIVAVVAFIIFKIVKKKKQK